MNFPRGRACRVRAVSVLLCWVALPCLAAPAQQATHTISGGILFVNVGPPKERLEVILTAFGLGPIRKEFAGSNGRFTFSGLKPGNYTITVKMPFGSPYEDGLAEVSVEFNPIPTTYSVLVMVERKASDTDTSPRKRTVSAGETEREIPQTARKAYDRGVSAVDRGRLEEAVGHFREALAIAPDYLFALNDLGVQLMRLDCLEEATATLARAVELAPSSYPPHQNLALALFRSGKLAEASEQSARALAINPEAPSALFVSGQIARALGNRDAAVAAFTRAFVLSGGQVAEAQFELARLYEEAEMLEQAIIAYRTFLGLVKRGPYADAARERLRALGAS
jgi:tetratricopeptide (TPR) repeat protein